MTVMARFCALTGAVALALGGALVAAAPSTAAPAAPTVGWWDASRTSSSSPGAPASDVPAGGGLVEGVHPAAAPLPATAPVGPQPSAVTALRFALPAGLSATTLRLKLVSSSTATANSAVTGFAAPLACALTGGFTAGAQQAWPPPTYDCGRSSLATDDGTSLVFTDIGRLQRGSELSFVLLPGTADRVVIAPPTADALTVVDFRTAGPAPAPTPAQPGADAPPVVEVPSGPSVPLPRTGGLTEGPALPPVAVPGGAAPTTAPVVQAAQPPVPQAAVSDVRLPQRSGALLAALAVLALATAAAFWRDPDRAREGAEAGLGRFRAVREGRAPAL